MKKISLAMIVCLFYLLVPLDSANAQAEVYLWSFPGCGVIGALHFGSGIGCSPPVGEPFVKIINNDLSCYLAAVFRDDSFIVDSGPNGWATVQFVYKISIGGYPVSFADLRGMTCNDVVTGCGSF